MQGFGVLALSCGVWLVFCGVSSFDPVKTAQAIAKEPAKAQTILKGAKEAVTESASARVSSGGSFAAVADPVTETNGSGPAAYQAYAQSLFPSYGWGADQLPYLVKLWNRESSWNPQAKNPSSGAYGIPQSLPASKMATAGADYLTNYKTQIKWGLKYISGRYSTPQKAWAHETEKNWY